MRDLSGLKSLTCALLLTASPLAMTSAMAQDGGGSTWLDAINVTGTRTAKSVQESPRSVTVIDKAELEKKAPESIAEMLRDVPGVEIFTSSVAGMKRVRIRGESSRRVTILVDGQEITDHSSYGTPILVDPSGVERIEVVRGPASVLHGSKAIGGVVNIITKKGADKPVQVELTGSYYSASEGYQGSAALSGTVSGFDYRVSGSLAKHEDRDVAGIEFDTTGKLLDSHFENDTLSGHFGYRFGAADNHYISMKLDQHRLESEAWISPSLRGRPMFMDLDLPQRDRKKVGLYYDGKDLGPVLKKVHVDGYYQTIDREFMNEVFGNRGVSIDTITDVGATAQADFQLTPNHYFISGAQYLSDSLDKELTKTTVFPFPRPASVEADKAEIRTTSVFAQDEWSIGTDFKLTGGLRYTHVETELKKSNHSALSKGNENKLLTSVGLTYTGIENTTLRGLFSQGYITPTLLQLFTPTTAGGGAIDANPNLTSESSNNYELGARFDNGSLVLDITGYYTTAEDYITSVVCPTCPPPYTKKWDNINEATTYGIELAAEYTIPSTSLTPYVTGAWTKRELQYASFSTYNTDTPELSGRFGIKYDWNMGSDMRGWADLYARASNGSKEAYQGRRGLVTDELSGWTTLNLGLGANYGEDDKYSLAVNFNNITNKSYRATFGEIPGTARNVEVTARMKF